MNDVIASFTNRLLGMIANIFKTITGDIILFQPILPFSWLVFFIILALLLVLISIFMRMRGSILRFLALLSLLLALANPVTIKEDRALIPSIIGVVVDKSPSQNIDSRNIVTLEAVEKLKTILAKYPQFEPRYIDAGMIEQNMGNNSAETKLFTALDESLADIPSSLYAGTIIITDGQVHDVAYGENSMISQHPINVLLTGRDDEYDRKISIIDPPRFGIKDKPLILNVLLEGRVKDETQNQNIAVSLTINGKEVQQYSMPLGQIYPINLSLPLAGKNIIELKTPSVNGEITDINNKVATNIDAVRENLRVLLVSGEPHNGERAWRDLLKSDTNIDLVHFTILRPPEKADNTPLNQLSLIVFPTTELFVDRLKDFDLVIFDRYQHYDVLPLIYYDYIAQYIKNGGALLMATGPEYSGNTSLARTPLNGALPAIPTGNVIERLFRPSLTTLGLRHPVTRGLINTAKEQEQWGRWLRQIEVKEPLNGQVVMNGIDNQPLLLLSHVEKGRVAMLLSDEGWLWARGFEGGGPYAALYRRIAHWLMQEPELEEESLTAIGDMNRLTITRQTMADSVEPVQIKTPSGTKMDLSLQKQQEGLFTTSVASNETGLYTITNGDKTTYALIGHIRSPEFIDFISTKDKLMPLLQRTGGHIENIANAEEQRTNSTIATMQLPNIRLIDNTINNKQLSPDHIILEDATQTRLINATQFSLFSGFFALLACLLLLSSMWYREGR